MMRADHSVQAASEFLGLILVRKPETSQDKR